MASDDTNIVVSGDSSMQAVASRHLSRGQTLVDALGQHSTLKLRSPLGQRLPPRLSRSQLRRPLSVGSSSSSIAPRASSPSLSAKLGSLGGTQALSLSPRLKASSSTPIPLQVESQVWLLIKMDWNVHYSFMDSVMVSLPFVN
ncbi:hypothetical protein TorRG33x02_031810 [Trema orientale]|uniref:Uncharacterized protein n=1 Tax=Trema orientale TaxID=63057 RepID=A0A2P5FT65_TREOI|nr:hypothetical protein TorRG33x02_031810 [Trema orientale]